jgi:hypothetical protein
MRTLRFILFALIFLGMSEVSAQSNKIVFGPLEGDDAGVLTVHNAEAIGIEMWVRTDPDNPAPIRSMQNGLLSENIIIAERGGMDIEPPYDFPNWYPFVDGPYVYDDYYEFPIPPGWTCEMHGALPCDFPPCDFEPMDTQGEWDLYGTWLMITNTGIPIEQTYFPFDEGWYPHNGIGTRWAFEGGGGVTPEQSYCGLYMELKVCSYIPGDCDANGNARELTDVVKMIAYYRGFDQPGYVCYCTEQLPEYMPSADADGNCTSFELTDVVKSIAAYRGPDPLTGCPDCPGSEGLVIRENEDQ